MKSCTFGMNPATSAASPSTANPIAMTVSPSLRFHAAKTSHPTHVTMSLGFGRVMVIGNPMPPSLGPERLLLSALGEASARAHTDAMAHSIQAVRSSLAIPSALPSIVLRTARPTA